MVISTQRICHKIVRSPVSCYRCGAACGSSSGQSVLSSCRKAATNGGSQSPSSVTAHCVEPRPQPDRPRCDRRAVLCGALAIVVLSVAGLNCCVVFTSMRTAPPLARCASV